MRVELLDAVALQGLQEVPLRQLDAFEEALEGAVGGLARASSGHALDAAADVVGHVQHVAGEIRHRVGAGIGDLALRPAAQVFHVGHQTQELVLELVLLGLENRDRIDLGIWRSRAARCGSACAAFWCSVSFGFIVNQLKSREKGVAPHIRSRAAQIKRCGAAGPRFRPS